jgi:hypothetical protein
LRRGRHDLEGVLDSPLPSAVPPAIYARNGDIFPAVIGAVAMIFVIRRRAANQFRKSGMVLISQPGFSQMRLELCAR